MIAQSFQDKSFDTTQDKEYLPKPPLDLPTEPKEIPAHTHPEHAFSSYQHTDVKTLLAWSAPGRPYKQKGKEYYLTALLIMLLVQIILFLFSQYLLMLVVLSFTFLSLTLSAVPPRNFHYRVSTEGITVEDHFFLWQELYDFYFKKRSGIQVLHIRTHAYLPGELTITLGEADKEHVKTVLLPYLPYREFIKPTFMEKSGDWLSRNFPLERSMSS